MKSLKEIAWNVDEPTYRADSCISYSTLSTFDREGFTYIPHLFDKKDTEALRFGSLVDTLITEPETLNERFYVARNVECSDAIIAILKDILDTHPEYKSNRIPLSKIDDRILMEAIIKAGYQSNWRPETRVKVLREKGTEYFNNLTEAGDLTVVTSTDLLKANACKEELINNPYTRAFFYTDPFNTNREALYQLKFRLRGEYNIRCMFDLLLVDHEKKIIQPVDLKTTGKNEDKFYESFITWKYYLQATMYSFILQRCCMNDEYFKDFKINPFCFICINKESRTPLVWVYKDNLIQGDRINKKTGERYKSWKTLYKELKYHLDNNKYSYSYDSYHNKGVRILDNLIVAEDENN